MSAATYKNVDQRMDVQAFAQGLFAPVVVWEVISATCRLFVCAD
jgi:hypothetical protein